MIGLQLEVVNAFRAPGVKSLAARNLGDISPESLEAIIEFHDHDNAPNPGGEAPIE